MTIDITTLADERDDLLEIAGAMARLVPQLEERIDSWRGRLRRAPLGDSSLAVERHLEEATRDLRHIWLAAAANSTSKAYRSPTEDQPTKTPSGRFHNFGYERDLQPETLERRCAGFFPKPPSPWHSDHVLFSSGQAAMTAALTYLASTRDGLAPLRVAHAGSYFETADLLMLFGGRLETVPKSEVADLVIAEPLFCTGEVFGTQSAEEIAALVRSAKARCLIVDSTLLGLEDDMNVLLSLLPENIQVFRVHSGLKLFQQGLELADVGIVSVFGYPCGDELRRIRTLHGAGLRFADVAALELPLFLDPLATRGYEEAVFLHNARLAESVAAGNGLFETVSHPSLTGGRAPFCIFTLKDKRISYDVLETAIARACRRQELVFDLGGSFGFRGHRYEVVRPEQREPFLRIAMGSRGGPSLEAISALLAELSL